MTRWAPCEAAWANVLVTSGAAGGPPRSPPSPLGLTRGGPLGRRRSGEDRSSRHIVGHDCAGSHYRPATYSHSLQDDRPAGDPHAVADQHRLGHRRTAADGVLVSVHDDDIPCDRTHSSDTDFLLSDDLRVAVEVRSLADEDPSTSEDRQADS